MNKNQKSQKKSLRKKNSYSEFFWSMFSRTRAEYGEILRIFFYSIRMRENTRQKNSEYGHYSLSVHNWEWIVNWTLYIFEFLTLDHTAQKCFPLKISSVNVTKSAENCLFGHTYWRKSYWKTSFFAQCLSVQDPRKGTNKARFSFCCNWC